MGKDVLRRIAGVLLAATTLLLLSRLPVQRPLGWLAERRDGLGTAAPVLFTLLYVAATLVFVPSLPLAIGAGALFGPVVGTAVVAAASTASAALSFLAGRRLGQTRTDRILRRYPRFARLYGAFGEPGAWKLVAALRQTPLLPYGLTNLLLGTTPLRLMTFLVASGASMLPATVLYTSLGHFGAQSLRTEESRLSGPGAWFGVATATVALLYLAHRARLVLNERRS